ncbi:MAG TPA: hypothetical protein VM260_00300 [Pirellula sp.]|nr:hypothetical protein [Pirellula sp.]
MLSSVRKKIFLSLIAVPLTFSCGFAQSPVGALTESNSGTPKVSLSTQMNDLFLNQWIHVDGSGSIRGSVVTLLGQDSLSLSKMRVSLTRNGDVIAWDDTDVDGDFLIEKLSPGLYSLTAEGSGSLAMFSLVVLDQLSGQHLPNSLVVRVMPFSSRVSEILRGQSNPKPSTAAAPSEDSFQKNRKLSETHQVLLDSQGTLNGRLGKATGSVDMSSMTVFIMKDGEELKRAKVESDGSFAVKGLSPACYGLVAAGDQGVAATGFCAVNRSVVSTNTSGKLFVAQSNELPTSLNIEVADNPGSESLSKNDVAVKDTVPLSSSSTLGMGPGFGAVGGGSYGGGFGGGGGAGRIGGGIGSLAAIGGLIAVGIIAADNNRDAPVVSPIVP